VDYLINKKVTMIVKKNKRGIKKSVKPKTSLSEQDESNPPKEIGGREGLDPTRFGDWEKSGRCIDF
jgi:hypothetical protein